MNGNTYTRNITNQDINALGDDWFNKIDKVITTMINASDPKTGSARVLQAMGVGVPITIAGIVANHNIIHGVESLAFNYARFVITGLLKAELISRVRSGVYIREG